ncbi:hypothetical protein [Actinoplanes sp. NPDC049265]|uniref:hypothetical protein n=1 Tax=Actinoplanes sp. NPDC049265 TaxID=3363902 RepID=UPI003720D9F3
MKRIGAALLWIAGAYCVARALIEPFVIDFSDPSTYRHDWGGPTLVGVLFVHCGLGVLAAALMAWRLMRRSSLRLTADRPAPPSADDDAGGPEPGVGAHRVGPLAGVGAGRGRSMAGVGAGLARQQERGAQGGQDHQERTAEAAHR